jgi:aspartate carbamoyltransferase regulatory subunit
MTKQKIIGYIQNGIVVDHIPVGKVWEIVHILGIDKDKLNGGRISLGEGYGSKKLKNGKGILKVEGITLSDLELNYIALIAEGANVSFIEDGEVREKINVRIPSRLEGIVACTNQGCISKEAYQKASSIIDYDSETETFRCHYCHHAFGKNEAEVLI